MADTTTANYNWTKPEVGASSDTWGAKINADLDAIDARMKTVSDAAAAAAAVAAAALPLAGGTVTGQVTFAAAPIVDTPNSGTTGGLRIAGNAVSNLAILQFTDSTNATEWGHVAVTSDGKWSFSGTASFAGGLVAGHTILDAGAVQRVIGFLDMPLTAGTAGRAIVLADRGMAIPATGNITIPTDATLNFPIGSVIGIYNNSAAPITIAAVTPGTTTLRLGGTALVGTRTLAQRGYVVIWKEAANEWVALNGGIS
jgi:hypothetical protein